MRKMTRIRKFIVHCSGSSQNYTIEQMRNDHLARGFDEIAYHFVIVGDQVFQTRSVDFVGAHCRGENHDSIGICLIGKRGNFAPGQFIALERLVRRLLVIFPNCEIRAHNYFNKAKTCPDFDVEVWKRSANL
jgi:N-acetyl-anhydromuramyl-L-alanine amidase AmpD